MSLAEKHCVPCRGGTPPMERTRAEAMLRELDRGWRLNTDEHLERSYAFDDFAGSMAFANRLAEIAEAEGHHPDLHIAWGECTVEVWTHKAGGLTESDFVLAAKADLAFRATQES